MTMYASGYQSSDSIPAWWRHQMEAFSVLLAHCEGNSPVTGEFPSQRPVTGRFDVCLDLRLNKQLSKQWRGWRFVTPSRPLWRQCNEEIHRIKSFFNYHDRRVLIYISPCNPTFKMLANWMPIIAGDLNIVPRELWVHFNMQYSNPFNNWFIVHIPVRPRSGAHQET